MVKGKTNLVAAVGGFLALVLLGTGMISAAGFCLFVVAGALVLLAMDEWPPDAVMLGATVLMLLGSWFAPRPFLRPESAWLGFGQPAVITVAVLFGVAAAVRNTGLMERLAEGLLARATSERSALAKLAAPLLGLSAFLNNTPIVAIFMPVIRDWAVRKRMSPSKFLIPLSYLTILGGTCTLIGTSTNLLVSGMMADVGLGAMGLFELAQFGIPCAIVGTIYLLIAAPLLLPGRRDMLEDSDDTVREYLVEMEVTASGNLAGKNIEEAGLRHLEGLFLFQVRRNDEVFAPVKREFVVEAGDVCVFAGERDRVLALQGLPGLSSAHLGRHVETGERSQLLEVVISNSSPLIGRTIREVRFNRKYDATVLALHRNGERVDSELKDTAMRAGDTLLLIGGLGFRRIWQRSADFFLVSPLRQDLAQPQTTAMVATIVIAMIVLPAAGFVPITITAPVALIALVTTGCLKAFNLHRHVDWSVLVVIGCAFGISRALNDSGASYVLASWLATLASGFGLIGALALVYLVTSVTTEAVTNNAAAALVFPVAIDLAAKIDGDQRLFALVVAIAASASFATPVGYQTNMMVYGPGGYRYRDFLKIGLPLNILCGITTVLVAATMIGG